MFARKSSGKTPNPPEGPAFMGSEEDVIATPAAYEAAPQAVATDDAPRAVFGKKSGAEPQHHSHTASPSPSAGPILEQWEEMGIASPQAPAPAVAPAAAPIASPRAEPRMDTEKAPIIPREITRAPLQDDEMTETTLRALAASAEKDPISSRAPQRPVHRGIMKAEIKLDMGIIAPLMRDDSISDILINGTGPIYVERGGLLEQTPIRFANEDEVQDFGNRILNALEREIDPLRPLADARLPDGSRVNIIMPPMSVDGTTISIRKFPSHKITIDTMVQSGLINDAIGNFLKACGRAKLNVIVSGGTGAGKTTLLNALSQFISHKERIVTIEDSAELQLQQPHVVRLETKRAIRNNDKSDEVNVRDLVINSLRMRPDRIIVGEVRGGEAFDMLQAMNTGHEGSMATLHANSPRDAMTRLENMINMADMGLSQKFIRQQMASAISIVLQIARFRDGSRRITHITEVVGLENEMLVMQDLFTFNVKGEDENGKIVGGYEWANIIPRSKELSDVARTSGLFAGINKR